MATYNKLPSGSWRAQVRRKGQSASKTFRLKSDAKAWAIEAERSVDLGRNAGGPFIDTNCTFGRLIDLHITDMGEVRKQILRGKGMALEKLKTTLGHHRLQSLNRQCLIAYGKDRAKAGAGPATLSADIGYIRTILVHAAAVHGINVPTEQVTLARVALRRLGLVGKSRERDRRPTQDELSRIISFHDNNPRRVIPLGRIVKFAVATGMRQSEICALRWTDIDLHARLATVRNRKDPRNKQGNHQQVPLLDVTGFDAIKSLEEQRLAEPLSARVFPYNATTVGASFRRACRALDIRDLRFHDLRHEATSRLFEAGFDIPEVSLVTGHKDWKMLQRYLNLKPAQLLLRRNREQRYQRY